MVKPPQKALKKTKKPNYKKIFFSVKLAVLLLASCFSFTALGLPQASAAACATKLDPLGSGDATKDYQMSPQGGVLFDQQFLELLIE